MGLRRRRGLLLPTKTNHLGSVSFPSSTDRSAGRLPIVDRPLRRSALHRRPTAPPVGFPLKPTQSSSHSSVILYNGMCR